MSSNSSFYSASGTSQTLERSVADAAADAEKLAINAEDAQFTLSDGTTVGFSALHHKNKSITAQTASETAKTGSEAARNTAETHRDDAQKLSLNAEDAGFTLADGVTTGFSALHYNAKALASKTAAATSAANSATSETNSAASEAAAASSQTSATASAATSTTNANATAADVVTTNADVVTTTADKATVAADKAIVAADKALVNTDKVASAASAAAALASQNAAATSETNAATSETNAAASATTATTKATNAATSETNAATSATNAGTSATAAAASQVSAAASASAAALALDSFDDRYLGAKTGFGTAGTGPTLDNDSNALVSGALFFSSDANEMRVYEGASWIAASSAGGVSLLEFKYTATANQTTFTGADDASNTLSYIAANLIVTLNGIVLENGADYTASNGSSVVLTSGAAANDELNIIAFKSFTTADMVSKTNGGAFSGAVNFTGGLSISGTAVTSTAAELNILSASSQNGNAGEYLTTDGTSASWVAVPTPITFASGTKMLFGQTAAPTGWTKITTDDDAALRIVSGTVGTGGSVGLSTALATPSVTGTIAGSTGNHTLAQSQIPSHRHSINTYFQQGSVSSIRNLEAFNYHAGLQGTEVTNYTGGGNSHSHSLSATFSNGLATINVKYVDTIMASKD